VSRRKAGRLKWLTRLAALFLVSIVASGLVFAAGGANEQQGHDELLHLQPVQQALRLRSPQPQPALQGEAVGLPPGTSDRQSEPEALDAVRRPIPASPGATRGEAALAAFRQGYRQVGGPEALLEHFVERVLSCEAGVDAEGNIDWTPGNAEYRSAAQAHPLSWERVEREVGRVLLYEEPYDVGIFVAVWIRLIGVVAAGTNAGWPICWWH